MFKEIDTSISEVMASMNAYYLKNPDVLLSLQQTYPLPRIRSQLGCNSQLMERIQAQSTMIGGTDTLYSDPSLNYSVSQSLVQRNGPETGKIGGFDTGLLNQPTQGCYIDAITSQDHFRNTFE